MSIGEIPCWVGNAGGTITIKDALFGSPLADNSLWKAGRMRLPEEEATRQVNPELSNDNPGIDDIYVPGLGVRGALSDDDTPRSSFSWARVSEGCTRSRATLHRATSVAVGGLRNARFRVVRRASGIASNIKAAIAYRPKFPGSLVNSQSSGFNRARTNVNQGVRAAASKLRSAGVTGASDIVNTAEALGAYRVRVSTSLAGSLSKVKTRLNESAHFASCKIRNAGKKGVSATPRVKGRIVGATCAGRAQIFKAFQNARSSRARVAIYRPQIPAAIVHGAQNAHALSQSLSKKAALELRKFARSTRPSQLAISFHRKLDLVALRRALPALAVLLTMMVFAIQEIVAVVKR